MNQHNSATNAYDFAPLLERENAVTSGPAQWDVGQRCFSSHDNEFEIEVGIKAGSDAKCKHLPLSLILARVKSELFTMEMESMIGTSVNSNDQGSSLKGRVYLAYEAETTRYNSATGKYTYHSKVVVPAGCYAPILRRHMSAYKAYFLNQQTAYDPGNGDLNTHPVNLDMNPDCKYEFKVVTNGNFVEFGT